jgi:hypothetical protein
VGDNFWMEDRIKVEWDGAVDFGSLFQKSITPTVSDKISFLDSQIKEYVFQDEQYLESDTGSQYLDTAWRHKIIPIHSRPTKIPVLISLN